MKTLFRFLGREYARRQADLVAAAAREAMARLAKEGAAIAGFPPAERARWARLLPDLAGDWVARNRAKGPARAKNPGRLHGRHPRARRHPGPRLGPQIGRGGRAMDISMEGRVALVTGGGGGMGRETARLLAGQGARVAVCDLDGDAAAATGAAIEAAGGIAWTAALDVADPRAVDRAMADAAGALGPVDALGQHRRHLPGGRAGGHFRRRLGADVRRPCRRDLFLLPRGAARHGSRGAPARSSTCPRCTRCAARPTPPHYAAAKGAIIGLTKSIAREKGKLGIRVNAVAPGPIDTPLWRGAVPADELDAAMAKRAEIIPVGRLGRAGEVAQTIVWLLTPAAGYITGQVIAIDGGEVMA